MTAWVDSESVKEKGNLRAGMNSMFEVRMSNLKSKIQYINLTQIQ